MNRELPLYRLFERFSQSCNLGMDKYILLLKALQGGFGIESLDSLKEVCKTLWIHKKEEEAIFNRCFEILIIKQTNIDEIIESSDKEEDTLDESNLNEKKEERKVEVDKAKKSEPIEEEEVQDETESEKDESDIPDSNKLSITKKNYEITKRNSAIDREIGSKIDGGYVLEPKYPPKSVREMQQNWAFLRNFQDDKQSKAIDIEATTLNIAKSGVLADIIFKSIVSNDTDLMILLDRGGSMIAFHHFCDNLLKAARSQINAQKIRVYYFHDYPLDYLYKDESRMDSVDLKQIYQSVDSKKTLVLIVSDGGAARNRYNPNRIDCTKDFVQEMAGKVKKLAWLNPMPEIRWKETTAEKIKESIPMQAMYDLEKDGLEKCIKILRNKL